MTIREAKKLLRVEVVGRILALSPIERQRQEARLLEIFADLPGWDGAKTVLMYASALPEEINTRPYFRLALDRGKTLVLPVVNVKRKQLELRETTDPDRQLAFAGRFGIPEPQPQANLRAIDEIDWILTPGIAFDATGARLGRGGGYYDRLLSIAAKTTTTSAILFDEQWVDEVPVEPHDVRIHALLRPSGLHRTIT